MVNSEGAQATNGFGLLSVQTGKNSGLVLFDGLEELDKDCLVDYICQTMGYRFAYSSFEYPIPFDTKIKWTTNRFIFKDVSCSVNHNDTAYRIKLNPSNLESKFSTNQLFCGPFEGACPILERNNFLKRICLKEFGYTVFQCPYSNTLYMSNPVNVDEFTFSSICDNDPKFYQYCGMTDSHILTTTAALCDKYVCTIERNLTSFKGNTSIPAITASPDMLCYLISDISNEYNYNSIHTRGCHNIDLPKNFCATETETENIVQLRSGLKVGKHSVCNGRCDAHYMCEDEAFCGGYLYGMYCIGWQQVLKYIKPSEVCNGYPSYLCKNDEDELNCPNSDSLSIQNKCPKFSNLQSFTRPIFLLVPILNNTRCSAPSALDVPSNTLYIDPICANFLDQTNCTDTNRSRVNCDIGGHRSTVSTFFVCHGEQNVPTLCDNGIDQVCEKVSLTCKVHKHQLCDGIEDCPDAADEKLIICLSMSEKVCNRAYKHEQALEIPLKWVRDGVEDCLDGMDEEEGWQSCGIGATKRYVVSVDEPCKEVFLCKPDEAAFIEFRDLCDGTDTCGHVKRMCEISHMISSTFNKAMTVKKSAGAETILLYCLPGLESLQELANQCVSNKVNPSGLDVFGVHKYLSIVRPDTIVNCDYTFGEIYLILSCAGFCGDSICPLKNKIQYNSCPQQYFKRIYTVADNNFLSFVTKSGKEYKNDFFRCDNNVCLNYDKVCNVKDDCGDGSDERFCTNVFMCKSKEQLIPITEKCDGEIDCLDFSDECNSDCGREIIQSPFLKILCWCLAVAAIALNMISVYRTSTDFNKEISKAALNNKLLILLINVGDLLIGVYLFHIAVIDTVIYASSYCFEQLNWLSSVHCTIIGVLSTIGYEMSLLSMTALGITRLMGIQNGTRISGEVSRSAIRNICLITTVIVLMSIAIAVVPLVPQFEDFFVNGMTYDPSIKLFIGAPGKEIHHDLLEEYYGKIKKKTLKWRTINDLVDGMFSNDYGVDVLGRKRLKFYGNEGVCLFKFFVKADDPQRIYTWVVISMNMICFAIISVCYIFINILTSASSKVLTREKAGHEIRKRNRRLQRKISLIIGTDFFCWLPITIASGLHSGAIIDATQYYALISIVFLPINSVINPVLYNDFFSVFLGRFYEKVVGICLQNRINPENNQITIGTDDQNREGQIIEMKTIKT